MPFESGLGLSDVRTLGSASLSERVEQFRACDGGVVEPLHLRSNEVEEGFSGCLPVWPGQRLVLVCASCSEVLKCHSTREFTIATEVEEVDRSADDRSAVWRAIVLNGDAEHAGSLLRARCLAEPVEMTHRFSPLLYESRAVSDSVARWATTTLWRSEVRRGIVQDQQRRMGADRRATETAATRSSVLEELRVLTGAGHLSSICSVSVRRDETLEHRHVTDGGLMALCDHGLIVRTVVPGGRCVEAVEFQDDGGVPVPLALGNGSGGPAMIAAPPAAMMTAPPLRCKRRCRRVGHVFGENDVALAHDVTPFLGWS